MDIEALCINPIMNKYPYEKDTDDYISLNGCDYCSSFEPKKEDKNEEDTERTDA